MSPIEVVLLLVIGVPAVIIASFPLHVRLAFSRSKRPRSRAGSVPAISVIVPLRGADEEVAENLQRLATQEADVPLEIVVCVEEEAGPEAALLRRVASATRSGRLRLIATGDRGTSLGKIHNLMAGVRAARGEWLVFLDSDVALPRSRFIADFVEPLADGSVGLVTCYPAYRGARSLPAAILAATINHDLLGYFAMQVVWRRLKLANGACMAIRRSVLEAIGGLEECRRALLMDSILAREVVAAGYGVHLFAEPVPITRPRVAWRDWWHQAHRWQVAMARVLPSPTYLGFCWMRSSFALAILLALLGGSQFATVPPAVLVIRAMSAMLLNYFYHKDPNQLRFLWLLPIVELLNAAGCAYAVVDRRVTWRGIRYRVGPAGLVSEMAGGER